MPTDRQIVEAILPRVLVDVLVDDFMYMDSPKDGRYFGGVIEGIIDKELGKICLDAKEKERIKRRTHRVIKTALSYFKANNMRLRKALIIASEWAIALDNEGLITIDDPEFIDTIESVRKAFEMASGEIEGWEDIENDALQAGVEFHQFMQGNEYYKSG